MYAVMNASRAVVPNKGQTSRSRASFVVASLKQNTVRYAEAAAITVASFSLSLSANALTIKMGADDGSLVFEPASATVKSGEEITWVNNKGFPHNIIFDEDEVPEGVDADALSREDYLNSEGETYSVKLTKPGTYGFYCQPHQGAGMAGKINVQ